MPLKRLSALSSGEKGTITRVYGHGAFRKRITEMGFVKGKEVEVIKQAPLQDPVEYLVMGYHVSLRRKEAHWIEVTQDVSGPVVTALPTVLAGEKVVYPSDPGHKHTIHVALTGNPNSGKTTLFNRVSGAHEKVGNYGGVTIEAKEALHVRGNYTFRFVDLPGTYSMTEYSPEELYVRKHLLEQKPDIVLNVVDASNLERNLYLTTQLIDMNQRVVMALNMYDELEKNGKHPDYLSLGKLMGIPVVPTVASKGRGLEDLLDTLILVYENRHPGVRPVKIQYGGEIEQSIAVLEEKLLDVELPPFRSVRYLAIKLLESDRNVLQALERHPDYESFREFAVEEKMKLRKVYKESPENALTDARYGFIAGALKETFPDRESLVYNGKKSPDDWLTHKIWGIPIFFFLMWLMFQATFTLGNFPMEWIDSGISSLGSLVNGWMPAGPLKDLLVDGVIGGVGSVIVFLPNILILFFFISLMEDTGYMARASFIMDKLMHFIGLHGKSFIPLLIGFGCNVPAIMATRTLESRKDRILTMMIIPFMSCSARLPVYVLLISAFFPENQGLVLFGLYVIGILIGVITALLLQRSFFKTRSTPFVMELPPYRIPTMRSSLLHMWHKSKQYLSKMGTVILVASVLIWALGYFPLRKDSPDLSGRKEFSYIGQMGHWMEPVLSPLGFDWKMGVSILTGIAAKEVVVSSMGILYLQSPDEVPEVSLTEQLKEERYTVGSKQGEKVFSPLVALCFMLFILIYFPCVATLAAIRKEAGWHWALFAVLYTTGVAWLISFLVFQGGVLMGL